MSATVGELAGRSVSFGEARYVLDRLLATGGMGEVYLARRVVAGRFVEWITSDLAAIKVLRRDVAHLAGHARTFADEVRLHRSLSHPNIVAVRGVAEEGTGLFMLMDYLEGNDLRELLRMARAQGKRLSEGAACTIVAQVADALDYVHRATDDGGRALHIVHRDVSPSNIRITVPGEVRLMDFSVARCDADWREKTSPSWRGFKGKAAYLSPEQVNREPLDGRSDLFALGAVLVECLAGRRLFDGEEELQVLQAIQEVSPASVDAALEGAPEDLKAISHRLLARERAARYATGREAAAALRDYAFGKKRYLLDSRTLACEIAQLERREVGRFAPLEDAGSPSPPPVLRRGPVGLARLLGAAALTLLARRLDPTPSPASPARRPCGAGRRSSASPGCPATRSGRTGP